MLLYVIVCYCVLLSCFIVTNAPAAKRLSVEKPGPGRRGPSGDEIANPVYR
jgi:hypothetical protein